MSVDHRFIRRERLMPLQLTPMGDLVRGARVVDELIAELRHGRIHTVAFVVPSEATGTLPLYEVAIATARRGWSLGIKNARYWFVTPEPVPLASWSPAARAAVAARLEPEGITFVGSTFADLRPGIVLLDPQGESLVVDRVVTFAEAGATSRRPAAGAHPLAALTRGRARGVDGRELTLAGATVAA
jgi:hypothetical protein